MMTAEMPAQDSGLPHLMLKVWTATGLGPKTSTFGVGRRYHESKTHGVGPPNLFASPPLA
jgi:hypothetical protein